MATNPQTSVRTATDYHAGTIGNLDDAWTRRLVASVVDTESSGGRLDADNGVGYYGRYQGGAGWLTDAGLVNREKYAAALKASGYTNDWDWGKSGGAQKFLADPANWNNGLSLDKYLASAEIQDQAFRTNSNATYQQGVRDGIFTADTPPNVVAGFLKARHLGGYDNAIDAAQGQGNVADANGTTTGKYYNDIARNNDGFDQYFVPGFQRTQTELVINPMADGVLKHGERGEAVTRLQQALNDAGIRDANGQPLPTTGYYGDMTEAAVRKYQEQQHLEVDGKAGKDTLTALGIYPGQQQTQSPAPQTPTPPTGQPPAANGQTQPPQPSQADKPSMADPKHPDNAMYRQALANLEQLGPGGGFKSRDELERAAAAVTADARASGLTSIDHIAKTNAASGNQALLVAVQGDPTNPASKNAYIDYNQAVTQTVDQSSRMAEAAGARQAQQPEAPQPENRVAVGSR